MKRLQITIVTREQGQLIDSVIDSILDDMFPNVQPMCIEPDPLQCPKLSTLRENLTSKYLQTYDVHHARCYQQYTSNFCGYHASFASICCLQLLEGSPDKYDILKATSFWEFKNCIERFLFAYRSHHHFKNEWPWRDRDILYGDFERTYNNVCKANLNRFTECQRHPKIEYMDHTWEFQFRNIVCNENSRRQLNDKLRYFSSYKNSSKLLVFTIMMGVTNHWTCLIALKQGRSTEFWFFDSRNFDYLNFSHEDVLNHIRELNKTRVKEGREPYEEWRIPIIESGMKDVQISLRLLVKCLKGEEELDTYHYNRQFEVFGEEFLKVMELNNKSAFQDALINWAVNYKHDLRRFFSNKIHRNILYTENRNLLDHMVNAFRFNFKKHRELTLLHDMAQARL